MESIRRYNLSQAAKIINIEKMGKLKIYKLLRELGIVDSTNMPVQRYIDEGYLNFRLTPVRISGFTVQAPVTLVVGERGLNFIKNVVDDYLKKNPQPIIHRRTSKILQVNGDIITFKNAFEE
jgi:phage antirepressor YoqD-like protein